MTTDIPRDMPNSNPTDRHVLLRHPWVPPTILVAVTCAIYVQVLGFSVMDTWDDRLFFLIRPELEDWWASSWYDRLLTPQIGYPIPLPTALHALMRQLPTSWVVPASHGLNLLFQCINVMLAYAVLHRWTEKRAYGFVATLLWATHPLLAESVAWLTNLKTVTLSTFVLGSLLVWEHHLREPSARRAGLSVILSVLALGCRPEAVLLGPVMVLRAVWVAGLKSLLRPVIWGGPAMLGALASAYIPLAVGEHRDLVATANSVGSLEYGIWERVHRIGAALALQIQHALAPSTLHPAYYVEEFQGWFVPAAGWVLALIWTTSAWHAWQHRHPAGWALVFAGLFYLPVSGVEFLPRFTADTYMYLPLMGLCAGLVTALGYLRKWQRRGLTTTLVALFCGVLATVTFMQTQRWESTLSLWRPVMEEYPEYGQAHFMVGIALARAGAHDEAVKVFDKGYNEIEEWVVPPAEAAVAYAETGEPERAAAILLDILSRTSNPKNERVDGFLVMLLSRQQLPWPSDTDRAQLARKAAERALAQRKVPAAMMTQAATYFRSVGENSLATAYLTSVVNGPASACDAVPLAAKWGEASLAHRLERACERR